MIRTGTRGSLEEELRLHARRFAERFRRGEKVRTFYSPGRVNLMGAHLDYNGGPVMPMSVNRGTFVAVAPRSDRTLRVAAVSEPGIFEGDLDGPLERRGEWVDYPLGVIAGLAAAHEGLGGLDVLFGGNLPVGAGLSSSASICVGTAYALSRLWELDLEALEIVRIALAAEREFVGVQCGIMDPYSIGLARENNILWLDCRDETYEFCPFDTDSCTVAVADTGLRRKLARGAFNDRVSECRAAFETLRRSSPEARCLRDIAIEALESVSAEMEPTSLRRARHVVYEVRRTFEAREALRSGDLVSFGRAMFEAHDSLRDLYEVSVPELDQLVESGREVEGVLGSRLTGAGFGGCAVALVRKGAEEEYASRVGQDFETRFGRRPAFEFFEGDSGPREA